MFSLLKSKLGFNFECFQVNRFFFCFFDNCKMFAASHILCWFASIQWFFKSGSNTTNLQSWTTIVAEEIPLTIIGSIKSGFTGARILRFWWACKSQVSFGITIWHQIWVITLQKIEKKTKLSINSFQNCEFAWHMRQETRDASLQFYKIDKNVMLWIFKASFYLIR